MTLDELLEVVRPRSTGPRPHAKSSFLSLILLIWAGMNVLGCSGKDQPSEEQAKVAILAHIKDVDEVGAMKLESFRKTNGQSRVKDGVPQYIMELEAEFEFMSNCRFEDGARWDEHRARIFTYPPSFSSGRELVLKGQKRKVEIVILFEKTDNGWRAKWVGSGLPGSLGGSTGKPF